MLSKLSLSYYAFYLAVGYLIILVSLNKFVQPQYVVLLHSV